MNKKIILGIILLSTKLLVAADEGPGTDVVLSQALSEAGGETMVFKTVFHASHRYGEAKLFTNLVRKVGLRYALSNYGGKKNVKGKKKKKFLSLIPQGQKLTVLAPINSALLPITNKIKAARGKDRKAAIDEALKIVQAHILKGEFTQATLKGQMDTIGGTKIDADKLQIFKADVTTGNGVFHVIKRLATDTGEAAQPVAEKSVEVVPETATRVPAEKPTEQAPEKPAEKPAEAGAEKPVEKP